MTDFSTSAEITRLLKKYGIALIVFELVSRIGLSFAFQLYQTMFSVEEMTRNYMSYSTLIVNLISVLMNLIIAIIILSDMDKKFRLTWIIFVMTLVLPWVGVVFFILSRVVEKSEHQST
jgi:hypothetical protein